MIPMTVVSYPLPTDMHALVFSAIQHVPDQPAFLFPAMATPYWAVHCTNICSVASHLLMQCMRMESICLRLGDDAASIYHDTYRDLGPFLVV